MLRQSILGISTLALMTATACADEGTRASSDDTASSSTETAIKTSSQSTILDAAQVKTKSEAKLYAESEFKQADINNDGSVDKNEFIAYAAVRAPMNVTATPGELDTKSMSDQKSAMTDEPESAEQQFSEISNGDEKISETEMVESRVAQFEEADANDDQQLDQTEREKFIQLAQLKPSAGTSL
ncbi:hypothetical protein PUV54_14725 [Hyphococcus flavus]|uniref:EF-hand domain-containing protein n=1 Tax=Hyphococcus flavus TaxID=1866326 RepID=A0AAE9ZEC5_9PROT|nr:hypothetical protein [Hyphococcus flavus]WDI31203.1 hypothetical protein PUV54_14725 [Hyphococcus flavus]